MTKSPCPSCDSTEYTSIWTLGCDGRCSDCPSEQAETETITKSSSQLLLDAYAKIKELEAENERLRAAISAYRKANDEIQMATCRAARAGWDVRDIHPHVSEAEGDSDGA